MNDTNIQAQSCINAASNQDDSCMNVTITKDHSFNNEAAGNITANCKLTIIALIKQVSVIVENSPSLNRLKDQLDSIKKLVC